MVKRIGKLICSISLSLVISIIMARGLVLAAEIPYSMNYSDVNCLIEEHELLRNNPEACGKCWLGVMVETITYSDWSQYARTLCKTYTAQGFYDYHESRVVTHSFKCSYGPCGNTEGSYNTSETRILCGVTGEIH